MFRRLCSARNFSGRFKKYENSRMFGVYKNGGRIFG